MLVSFIIVAYNAEKTIINLMNNLKEQDYNHKMMEVILVDGKSSDNTKMIMQNFRSENNKGFKQIFVLDNPKKTLPSGWNVALNESNGDIILRLDAHATIPSNFISRNVENIIRGENICGGKVTSMVSENNIWQDTLLLAENSMFGGGIAKFRRCEKPGYVSTLAFAAYKRCVFETVGGYDERLARTEDNEMHYRMKNAGFKFYFDPTIQSYRESRSSLKKLISQKYLNGYWIGLTMGIEPKAFSVYHLVPAIFVSSIFITALISINFSPLLAILLWSLYALTTMSMTVIAIKSNEFKMLNLVLPLLFFSLHISYGIGTLVGLVKMPFWRIHNLGYEKDCIVKETMINNK